MFACLVHQCKSRQIQSRQDWCALTNRGTSNDAEQVNRSTVQQCFAVRVWTASSSPSRGGTACDTVLSSRADNTLAGAQRIQAGMKVFLGDLCSAALPLSEINAKVRGRKRINRSPEQKQQDDPLWWFLTAALSFTHKRFYLRAATMLTVWRSHRAAEPIRMSWRTLTPLDLNGLLIHFRLGSQSPP